MVNVNYHLNLYREYRKDLNFCRSSKIKLFNFWPLLKPSDLWLHKFIEYRHLVNKNKSISIYSVHGNRSKMKFDIFRKKIFYTGENPDFINSYHDNCLPDVDLSLGFDFLNDPKYMRLPIWYLFFIDYNLNYLGVKNWVKKINLLNKDEKVIDRKFCSLVASHDSNGIRTKLFQILQHTGQIESGGVLLKNNDDLIQLFNNDKLRFLENYKFNLCLENSNRNGYVTEKIFHSLLAGSLPIYWGSENKPEASILNQDRILFVDINDLNKVAIKINELHKNPKLFLDFYRQDVFSNDAEDYIYETLLELEKRIKSI
jgi:hypothetical protein